MVAIAARVPARIDVYAGSFASQPLAFARVLDAADRAGTTLVTDDVEVIQTTADTRLAHYFDPKTVAAILRAATGHDTLILLLPGRQGAPPALSDPLLTPLGSHDGLLLRAPGGDWT